MDRRFFLQSCGYLFLGGLLGGCQRSDDPILQAYILRHTLPVQFFKHFKSSLDQRLALQVRTESSLPALYAQLQLWSQEAELAQRAVKQKQAQGKKPQHSPPILRMLSLGDYWMTQAIQNHLIQPLPQTQVNWQSIPEPWLSLSQRNEQGALDSTGQYWGAPYRWGATVLVYRKDKLKSLGLQLKDWSDLWHPELHQRISLLNQPREVIGLTLKSLGRSYNEADLGAIPDLSAQLELLHQQTRFYDSQDYIQPLILGDTWVAMGWSTDALAALSQESNLGVIFPYSGSALWADLWVQPATHPGRNHAPDQNIPDRNIPDRNKILEQWLNYWWEPEIARDISRFTSALSPIRLDRDQADSALSASERLLVPEGEDLKSAFELRLKRSEPILPLSPESLGAYQQFWTKMRLGLNDTEEGLQSIDLQ